MRQGAVRTSLLEGLQRKLTLVANDAVTATPSTTQLEDLLGNKRRVDREGSNLQFEGRRACIHRILEQKTTELQSTTSEELAINEQARTTAYGTLSAALCNNKDQIHNFTNISTNNTTTTSEVKTQGV